MYTQMSHAPTLVLRVASDVGGEGRVCEYSTVAVLWHLSDAGEGTVWEYSSCAVLPHRRVVDGLGLRTTNDELRTDVYLKRVTLARSTPTVPEGGRAQVEGVVRKEMWWWNRCSGGCALAQLQPLCGRDAEERLEWCGGTCQGGC